MREACTRVGDGQQLVMSTLSHDLRGPLASISGLARTLELHEGRIDPATRVELLRRIVSKADGLSELVADLLDETRFEGGALTARPEPVDVRQLVSDLVAQHDQRGRITVTVAATTIVIDPVLTTRILTNLLENALEHAGSEAHVWIDALATEEGIEFRVEDDGPGVPLADRERLFDAFHRTTSVTGHGFGLSVVARFARLQGGGVEVGDRVGGGASFRVWLPDAAWNHRPDGLAEVVRVRERKASSTG